MPLYIWSPETCMDEPRQGRNRDAEQQRTDMKTPWEEGLMTGRAVDMCTLPCVTHRQRVGAATHHRGLSSASTTSRGGGGLAEGGDMYTYSRFTLLCSRNWCNTVKQSYSKTKENKPWKYALQLEDSKKACFSLVNAASILRSSHFCARFPSIRDKSLHFCVLLVIF